MVDNGDSSKKLTAAGKKPTKRVGIKRASGPIIQEAIEGSVNIQDLMDAMNDESKAKALMDLHGWTRTDLRKRADTVARMIEVGFADIRLKLTMCC